MAVAFTNRVILPSRSVSGTIQLRIAKPLLLVSTPIGVLAGLREAWRFHGWLAALMALLLAVVAGFFWMTVRVARRESQGSSSR